MERLNLRRLPLALLAFALATPAAVFFLSAVGRAFQPTTHEPARTLGAIVLWFGSLSPGWIAVTLIAMPLIALILAGALLWRMWRSDASLRGDAFTALRAIGAVGRRTAFVVTLLVVAFGVVYFAALTIHAVAG
jgi:hypothetical protein